MTTLEIPEHETAVVAKIFVEITGLCGHTWSFDVSGGVFPDGWYVCHICWQPHKHDEYKYTKVLAKYPYLNKG